MLALRSLRYQPATAADAVLKGVDLDLQPGQPAAGVGLA
ncbi:MAG: hypothetical protein RLZZ11_1844, partial [Cyanobacteriota bacterium]